MAARADAAAAVCRRGCGFAMIEYILLVIIIVTALVLLQPYIRRGLQGQYRRAGESFGYLRQYNSGTTVDCAYDADLKLWYATACFENEVLKAGCTAQYPEGYIEPRAGEVNDKGELDQFAASVYSKHPKESAYACIQKVKEKCNATGGACRIPEFK